MMVLSVDVGDCALSTGHFLPTEQKRQKDQTRLGPRSPCLVENIIMSCFGIYVVSHCCHRWSLTQKAFTTALLGCVIPEAYPVVERIIASTGKGMRELIGDSRFLKGLKAGPGPAQTHPIPLHPPRRMASCKPQQPAAAAPPALLQKNFAPTSISPRPARRRIESRGRQGERPAQLPNSTKRRDDNARNGDR